MKQLTFIILLLGIFRLPSLYADNLGRLFFSPEQRMQLEQRVKQADRAGNNKASSVVLNGIVQHGGTRTVWLNGQANKTGYSDKSTAETVAIPGHSKPILLKVGQRVFLDIAAPPSASALAE
jgi:hypothetical protein